MSAAPNDPGTPLTIIEVRQAMRRHAMAEATFCKLATGSYDLLRRMRAGAAVTPAMTARVRDYIARLDAGS